MACWGNSRGSLSYVGLILVLSGVVTEGCAKPTLQQTHHELSAPTVLASSAESQTVASEVAPQPTLEPVSADLPPASRFKKPTVAREETRIVVLEYHGFGTLDDRTVLEPLDFEAQLDWLQKSDVEIVRTSDVIAFYKEETRMPARVAVVMIDDALRTARTIAFPLLEKRGIPFTLAINTLAVTREYPLALKWPQVREMLDSGLCEVASHGHKHGRMPNMSKANVLKELNRSRELIVERAGVTPRAFVYPFGIVDERVEQLTIDAGYEVAFVAEGRMAGATSPIYRIPRIGIERKTKLGVFPKLWEPMFASPRPAASALPLEAAPLPKE